MNMSITLRQRILLTLLPLLILLAVMGGAGVFLLRHLGGSIDVILRENYDSVVAMQELKEALERIDSSFQFQLVSHGLQDATERTKLSENARMHFDSNWESFEHALAVENINVTIHPVEDRLAQSLRELSERYRMQGRRFYESGQSGPVLHQEYYGKGGLYDSFLLIKQQADDILQLNQREMKQASHAASQAASTSLIYLSVGLAAAECLAGLLAWHAIRSTLRPIQAVTQAVMGIRAGNLDQVVPVFSRDELGQLAEAFNVMARHLRDYRQSQTAHLLRAQRTGQATIDSFPDAVLVIDADARVEMANPVARRLFGVAPKTPEQPASGIWQPPDALRQPLEEALLGQRDYLPESFDRIVLLGESGWERAFLPRIMTIRDTQGHTLGAAVLLQDVTRLRLLDQMKSNLVATASHELKTPLTSVRLAVHLLLEESTGPLTSKQIELLLDARENSERLLSMVNNLLDLARLEQGRPQLDVQMASPASLLRDAADAVRVRAQDKSVTLIVDVPGVLPEVAVDTSRMGHALSNLLDNALTYTDSGGTISLSAELVGRDIILSVKDTGSGIPPEYVPHVFEKFFRVPGQSRGSGTGLGLAIVNEIVTAHGGTVSCESQPGIGTAFHIRLPTVVDDFPREGAARSGGPASEPVR
ncbi:HAMP domain-containing sensor histidine kinase [Schlesneria paludicola]|uniref:HAMP domain-containing sensor histidine kinase n=1 Tax=Schlesneria paludicola TaxID=360056 RepID=UPI00030AE6EE|nr:ATP-binding protein [Schlesneria paludicola]